MSAWWGQGGPQEPSENPPPEFMAYVSRLGSTELKRMARPWIGPEANHANKAACLEAIQAGLGDRERVRGLVAGLSESDRAVLGVLKVHGGSAPPVTLASEVAALGLEIPPSRREQWQRSRGPFDLLNRLLDKGILLAATPGSSWGRPTQRLDSTYGMPALVFSDTRVLDAVDAVPSRPLAVAPLETAGASWLRRPGAVALDLLDVCEAVRRLGGIPTTREGRPKTPVMNRLTKTLGWEGRGAAVSGTPGLRHPTPFFVGLLQAWGALVCDRRKRRIAVGPEASRWMQRPYGEQAQAWVKAYRNLPDRFETSDGRIYQGDFWAGAKLGTGRGMLLQGLASLAESPEAWFEFEAFSDALFERLGEFFSIGVLPQFSAYDCRTPEQVRRRRAEWREGLRRQWRHLDEPWIADALRGPLYELGLVEVAFAPGQPGGLPTCFRLTDLARLALTGDGAGEGVGPSSPQAGRSPRRCLVVQPNFEVVAYLDRVPPGLLVFLGRAGERRSSGGVTATFRLTRESVYAALEAGTAIDELVGRFMDAAEHGLPPNVETTLREWAARRERLVVRRGVRLLEFPDALARDAAATARGRGSPVGDRWLLLDPSAPQRSVLGMAGRVLDYAQAPVRCLAVGEDGTVILDVSRADLFVAAEAARWADPEEEGAGARWRITGPSVERAVRAGTRADDILATLRARASHPLPPLLVAAIRAWGGTPHAATLTSATILRVHDAETFQAVASSSLLRKHFVGSLGSQALVVKPGSAENLGQSLMALGLLGGTDPPLAPLPPVAKPRVFPDAGAATSPIPVLEETDEGEGLDLLELYEMDEDDERPVLVLQPQNGGRGRRKLKMIEEILAASPGLAFGKSGLRGPLGLLTRPRRGPGRPRRRL